MRTSSSLEEQAEARARARDAVQMKTFIMPSRGKPGSANYRPPRKVTRPLKPKELARQQLTSPTALERNKALAAAAFPNNRGNYAGKRTPREAGPALTSAQRFEALQSLYV